MSAPQTPASPGTVPSETAAPPTPEMKSTRALGEGWSLLGAWAPVGDLGALPVNAFLMKGREPMLVDTGLAATSDAFMAALESEIDPADLKWIWLSHMDFDHIGNLRRVLARAPNATVITNFLGMAKLGLVDIAPERVHLLNPGESADIGGRRLTALRPVYYDAPETMGFYDEAAGALFVADSFGALLPGQIDRLDDADEATVSQGMHGWSSIDAPWLADQSAEALGRRLAEVESIDPRLVMSAHLPPMSGSVRRLTGVVGRTYNAVVHSERAAA